MMPVSHKRQGAPSPSSSQAGFTIVELMIVVAIVSIISVIALPAYQDYTVRSKVSEGVVFVGEAKTSVSARYYSTNIMPTNNYEAGLSPADDYDAYDFVKKLEVSTTPVAGTITLTIKIPGSSANDKQLLLVPSTVTGKIVWTCEPADPPLGIAEKHVPANCRG